MTPAPIDSLVFKVPEQDALPTGQGEVAFQLFGDGDELVAPDVIHNAAAAVLHFFREDRGLETVPVAEFSAVLEKVLKGLGFNVSWSATRPPDRAVEADLQSLAQDSGPGFELVFFQRLRDQVRQNLQGSPPMLKFAGLRGCVRHMTGARRWTGRCQEMNDQIVDFIRECLTAENPDKPCGLVVQ